MKQKDINISPKDRITENFRKQFYDEFGFCKNQYLLRDSNQFILEDFKQFLLTSIKEVEKETRKEIIKNINTHKTLVAVADGNKYFEVMSIGNIIVKPIKNIGNGASYKQVIYDESISITNKEIKK